MTDTKECKLIAIQKNTTKNLINNTSQHTNTETLSIQTYKTKHKTTQIIDAKYARICDATSSVE